MALNNAQLRGLIIRRKKAANENQTAANDNDGGTPRGPATARRQKNSLLADCIAAAGFEQHAAY